MLVSKLTAFLMRIGFLLALLPISTCALPLPFAFGNRTNDIFLGPADEGFSALINLTLPMAFLNTNVTYVLQYTNGYVQLFGDGRRNLAGNVNAYFMNIDTSNGGVDQNQIWLRVGNRTDDLNIARNIIAGNGTFFAPQAVIVATWYKVDTSRIRDGPQNTFQMAMAYSATGETWIILAYEQLQSFQPFFLAQGTVAGYKNLGGDLVKDFFAIASNATMISVLNGTNCNRTGLYAHRINKGGPTKAPTKAPTKTPTKAPTKSPTKAPTKAPIKAPTKIPIKTPTKAPTKGPTPAPTPEKCGLIGLSIFCPLTFCGALGRLVGLCRS